MSYSISNTGIKREEIVCNIKPLTRQISGSATISPQQVKANATITTLSGKVSLFKQVVIATTMLIHSIRDLVKSAFTRGYWVNDRPWLNDQTWSNKP